MGGTQKKLVYYVTRPTTIDDGKGPRPVWRESDPNRELITIIECVSAIGDIVPPMLIYKGKQIMASWTKDYDVSLDKHTLLAISESGWSNTGLFHQYLKHFVKFTNDLAGNCWRMLVFDGHKSHVDIDNVLWLLERRVISVCLPPHFTNIMQPLDVGCFGPLQKAYSDIIDRRLYQSGGRLTMSKQDL